MEMVGKIIISPLLSWANCRVRTVFFGHKLGISFAPPPLSSASNPQQLYRAWVGENNSLTPCFKYVFVS